MLCKYCYKNFDTVRGLHYHEYHCCKNPNGVSLNGKKKGKKKVKKSYPSKRKSRVCTDETKQKLKNLWNSEDYRQKQKDSLNKRKQEGTLGRKHTEESKQKISESMRKLIQNGNRKYSFLHRKSYEFNGERLDSSYELKVAQDLYEHNINFEVHPKGLNYIGDDGKQRTYFPDFYLTDYDVYLDPKNDFLLSENYKYHGLTTKEKIERVQTYNNVIVVLLNKESLSFEKIMECIKAAKLGINPSNTMESIEAVL